MERKELELGYIYHQSSRLVQVEHQRLHSYIRYTAIAVIVICTAVLIGWLLNIDLLKRVVPSFTAMNTFTAVGFILMAVWLMLPINEQALSNKGVYWIRNLL